MGFQKWRLSANGEMENRLALDAEKRFLCWKWVDFWCWEWVGVGSELIFDVGSELLTWLSVTVYCDDYIVIYIIFWHALEYATWILKWFTHIPTRSHGISYVLRTGDSVRARNTSNGRPRTAMGKVGIWSTTKARIIFNWRKQRPAFWSFCPACCSPFTAWRF